MLCSIALSGIIIFEYPVRYTLAMRQAPTVGVLAHHRRGAASVGAVLRLLSPGRARGRQVEDRPSVWAGPPQPV